jgi:hypothetical protein
MTFEEIASELQLFGHPALERVEYDRKRMNYRFAVTLNGVRLETSWRDARTVARDFDHDRKYAAQIVADARDALRHIESRGLEYFGAWGIVR